MKSTVPERVPHVPRGFPAVVRAPLLALALTMSGGAGATVASSARPEATDPSLAAALKRFESGRKAFDAGRYDEALGEFQASLELLSSPNNRMYIGRCYRGLGPSSSLLDFHHLLDF